MFLAGLFGFVLVFFVFCFVMGKVINSAIEKSDGPTTKWNKLSDVCWCGDDQRQAAGLWPATRRCSRKSFSR